VLFFGAKGVYRYISNIKTKRYILNETDRIAWRLTWDFASHCDRSWHKHATAWRNPLESFGADAEYIGQVSVSTGFSIQIITIS
jgi:hypothetical protein